MSLDGITVDEVAGALQTTGENVQRMLAGQQGISQERLDVLRRLINDALQNSGKKANKLPRLLSAAHLPASGLRAYTYRTCGGNSVIQGSNSPLWKISWKWDTKTQVWNDDSQTIGSLDGKIVLMDEVHNLITLDEDKDAMRQGAQNGCGSDQQCAREFQKRLYRAEKSMVVGFTATPNKTSPMDARRLLEYTNGEENQSQRRRPIVSYF